MPGGGWEGTILPQTPQPWQLHDLHKPSGSSSLGTWPPEGLLPVRSHPALHYLHLSPSQSSHHLGPADLRTRPPCFLSLPTLSPRLKCPDPSWGTWTLA